MHLSKMSRSQLIDIISELKVLATEKKEHARQLLLATPLLPKAILQAQVMLGVVTQQMLQMPNICQASFYSGQSQLSGVQTIPRFPPLAQNNLHSDLMLKSQESEVPAGHTNPLVQNNYTLPSTQPRVQLPILSQSKYQQQGPAPVLPGTSTVLPVHSQNMMNMSVRPQIQVAASPYAKQQVQPYLFQHQSQAAPAKLGQNSQLVLPQGIREVRSYSSIRHCKIWQVVTSKLILQTSRDTKLDAVVTKIRWVVVHCQNKPMLNKNKSGLIHSHCG